MAKTKWPPSEWRPRVKNTTNFCNQKGCKCMYITYTYYKSYNKVISVNNLNFGPVSVVVSGNTYLFVDGKRKYCDASVLI